MNGHWIQWDGSHSGYKWTGLLVVFHRLFVLDSIVKRFLGEVMGNEWSLYNLSQVLGVSEVNF